LDFIELRVQRFAIIDVIVYVIFIFVCLNIMKKD
jgi:hypothetical protein